MRERCFVGAMRLEVFLLSLGVVALLAPSASAALKKYGVARQGLAHYSATSPNAKFNVNTVKGSIAVVDESDANPALLKLVVAWTVAQTTDIPALTNGFIYFSQHSSEGFSKSTGTGSSSGSINWGNLGGWTISGQTWCHAVPSFACDLASAQESQTVDPRYLSSNYDIGTWTFHGTGWTMNLGYVNTTQPLATGAGNLMYILRGVRVHDGTLPALPLLGIAAVSASVLALGMAAVRRRRP